MNVIALKHLFENNNLSDEVYEETLMIGKSYESHVGKSVMDSAQSDLDSFIAQTLSAHQITIAFFVAMMRICLAEVRHDLFIRLTMYTGGLDVIENMTNRLKTIVSMETFGAVMDALDVPPLGTNPEEIPAFTHRFMDRLNRYLIQKQVHQVLVGNNHGLDTNAMLPEKALYEQANSLDDYLRDLHARKVNILEEHARTGKVWFEQTITAEVVSHVKEHPDMLSAVRHGDMLHIRKIPYDTKAYLEADDDTLRRYHACHCPFAKASIRNHPINARWCDCSAGFAKVLFDVIFDADLPVTCVKSVLAGDDHCAFVISLADIPYKK